MQNPSVAAIFVYGTLRRGGRLHRHMLRQPPLRILPATIGGRLISLGAYPALVPGDGLVLGEWFEYGEPIDELLRRLDRIEGAAYRRVCRTVQVESLGPRDCWLYEWVRAADAGPVVESGDWLAGAG